MSRLQIRLVGPDSSSFTAYSYGYELSNEPKSGHKYPNFRFGPNSPTASQRSPFSLIGLSALSLVLKSTVVSFSPILRNLTQLS